MSIKLRIALELILAASLAVLYSKISPELLNNTIAVQAILLGFSFNVLLFLLSAIPPFGSGAGASLEKELKDSRLEKLSEEVFYNISYFIVTAMFCLAAALLLLLVAMEIKLSVNLFSKLGNSEAGFRSVCSFLGDRMVEILRALFFFLLFESAYTFARTVGRVNYLFGQRMIGRN